MMLRQLRAVGRVCKTNIASNTAFRGFGAPQSMMISEAIIGNHWRCICDMLAGSHMCAVDV